MADAILLLRCGGQFAWVLFLCVFAVACRGRVESDGFFSQPPDLGQGLPADGIFPQGRKLAFMGYSGNPARDLTNGFTVAGPVYGDQTAYLAQCGSNRWPAVAHVGLRVNFLDSKSTNTLPDETTIRREIQNQLQTLGQNSHVVWWAVTPEELRPWETAEMNYLATVCDVIRHTDPRLRPIYLYNPNHRDAERLLPIARHVDLVGKGAYVNYTGRKRDRAWVRWSIEQELEAIRLAGRTNAFPLLNPELCQDPEPSEDGEIRAWVRHDVYLGLASGAKGVVIWSLYPRKEVKRTWRLWYDAYAECGRELNGTQGLSQVFLFGERRSDIKIRLVTGESEARVALGGQVETNTTSQPERAGREVKLPAWTTAEYAYGKHRWIFLIDSANTPATFSITGWPVDSRVMDVFTGAEIPTGDGPREFTVPAYGVIGLKFGVLP